MDLMLRVEVKTGNQTPVWKILKCGKILNQTKQDVYCYETRCRSDSKAQSWKNLAPKKHPLSPAALHLLQSPPLPPSCSLESINHVGSSRHPTPHQEQRLVSDLLLGSQMVAPRLSFDVMHFKWTFHLYLLTRFKIYLRSWRCFCFFFLKENKENKAKTHQMALPSSTWLKFVDMQRLAWSQRFPSSAQISITP